MIAGKTVNSLGLPAKLADRRLHQGLSIRHA